MVSSGMYDEAFKSYKKALEIEPFYQEVMANRDELLRITGKFLNDFKEEPEGNKIEKEFTSVFTEERQAEVKETSEPSFSSALMKKDSRSKKKRRTIHFGFK